MLVGYWNELSPGLVEWHARQRRRRVEESSLPAQPERRARSRDAATILDRLAGSRGVERVLVLDRPSWTSAGREDWFHRESGWLDPLRERIAVDGRFVLESSADHPPTGYALQVYRAKP